MFFHPCRDVRQAAWDPCSYRWIIWLKREIELCVIGVAMVGEAMCLYDGSQWCSVWWRRGGVQETDPEEPSDQLMCFGYLPTPGHPEGPTGEIGFKPAKWNPSDAQRWEGGQEDLMIDSVKSSRKIEQNEDWWVGIGLCRLAGLQWLRVAAVSVEWPLLKPDCLASSLLYCERNSKAGWRQLVRVFSLRIGRRETGL